MLNSFLVRINPGWVLIFFVMMVYGYFGAMTPSYESLINFEVSSIVVFFTPLIAIAIIYKLFIKNNIQKNLEFSVSIEKIDIFIYLSILVSLVLLSMDKLNLSLSGDELAFAQTGVIHGINLSKIASELSPFFDEIAFKYLVQFFSFFSLLAFGLLFFLCLKVNTHNHQLIVILLLLLSMRVLVSMLGGNTFVHPPLSSLFPLIFGAFFGVNDLIFKLSYFLPYTAFIYIFYKQLKKYFDKFTSYLFCLAFATVPVLWSLGSTLEPSLWSVICFSIVVFKLVSEKEPDYSNLVILVIIFSFFRLNSIVSLIPIFIHFLISLNYDSNLKDRLTNFFYMAFPLIALLPFIGSSLFYSSHYSFDQDLSNGEKFFQIFLSGEFFKYIESSIPLYWLVLVISSFLLPMFSRVNVSLSMFAIGLIIVFYSIPSQLTWGEAKFQAEYILPFALTGTWFLLQTFSRLNLMLVGKSIVFALLVANITFIINFPSNCSPNHLVKANEGSFKYTIGPPFIYTPETEEEGHFSRVLLNGGNGCNIISKYPFEAKKAYQVVTDLKKEGFFFSPGVHYGVLPQIMRGFDTNSIKKINSILRDQKAEMASMGIPWTAGDAKLINSDSRIQLVLLDLVASKDKLANDLLKAGWNVEGEFKNNRFETSVLILSRQ